MSRVRTIAVTALVAAVLAACGGGDGESPALVPTATPAPTATATPDPLGPATPQALSPANSQTISDGLCVASIPSGWVDDGTGRGATPAGHRYTLFGGRVRSDADWERAVELVRTQADSRPGATVEETPASILVTFADNRGFEYRERFAGIYCDITVTASSGPIPASERAFWNAIIESLAPAE